MSITPLMKGNAPIMHFSTVTDGGSVVSLPSTNATMVVWIHDSAGLRQGAGSLQNINASAGTVDYHADPADTANAGFATWWFRALLAGEAAPRDFDPQKVLVEDPAQI